MSEAELRRSVEEYVIKEEYEDDHGELNTLRVVLEIDHNRGTYAVKPNGEHLHFKFPHNFSRDPHRWRAAIRAIDRAIDEGERILDREENQDEGVEGPQNW